MEKHNLKTKAALYEICDILAGVAFPLMLQLILSTSIISYASYGDDKGIAVAALLVGEILLAASYFIFGRQNGITAYRKYVQQEKKRTLGTDDVKAVYKVGEYALWKGFAIGFISCIFFIVFQIIECVSPNAVCGFALQYVFGWAYFPFNLIEINGWFNLLWVIPFTCLHAAAYVYGKHNEQVRQNKIAEAEELKSKKRRK